MGNPGKRCIHGEGWAIRETRLPKGSSQTSNMGDDAAQIKALMGQLFEVIDVDGSGAIEEKEIKAWIEERSGKCQIYGKIIYLCFPSSTIIWR